jgi:NADP-dependent 3-hydroxy acid dehydrogenase YdfG
VLVTGASGGLGGAIVRACRAGGARVVATGRRADALDALHAELGDGVEPVPADLLDAADLARLLDAAGDLDVLVANAGLPASGALTSFEPGEIDRAIDVNLRAPMRLARAVVPGMIARGRGHLVFVSSLNGKSATAGSSVYAATKFGLRGFAFGLREDLRGTGVGVTTIFPGFVDEAGMFAASRVRLPLGVPLTPLGDVARAVLDAVARAPAEIDVAPLSLRLSMRLWSLAPETMTALGRRLGSGRIAEDLAAAQRDQR